MDFLKRSLLITCHDTPPFYPIVEYFKVSRIDRKKADIVMVVILTKLSRIIFTFNFYHFFKN